MPQRLKLDQGWFLQQAGDDGSTEHERLSVPSVPTDVYQVLLAHDKIADPVQDLNEISVRWIADKQWRYTTKLRIDTLAVKNGERVDLVFEGLDTFATVRLDGQVILEAENMFLSYRCNINRLVYKDEPNDEHELEIIFASARLRGQELIEEHKHEHRFIARQSEDSRIPVRKAQYHWGWDWGPILSGTSGPWRPVYLEYYSAKINDLWAETTFEADGTCTGYLHCETRCSQIGSRILFSISYDDDEVFQMECEQADRDDENSFSCRFRIRSPKLWYPFSHGPQPRYKISATLVQEGATIDQSSKFIGLRKVELIQEPDDSGKSFYFRINDVGVFVGGSCWIPASNHLSSLTRDQYHDWVQLLRDGNQNMIRVWGGGIYEDDSFYDACDELGVLVWQDFCFACGNYPTYPSFRSSVESEALQNLRRLRGHPSLVIWAGSNEDYQVQERYKLEYNYDDKDPRSWLKTDFPARYYYEYLFPNLVKREHPGAVYHPTSPWGDGKRSDDPTVGDIHQWNIWHGTMEKYQYSEKLCGRLVSEFGMVAYPHLETIQSVITSPEQRHPGSVIMDFHNKAIGHERRLMSYIAENFQVKYDLAAFIHLSQIVQAEAMAYAYKAWRKSWGVKSHRGCGGVLVWQLNDCWPTISWAIVDHYRVKKPAYYSIQRALAPCAVGISRTCHDWSQTHMNAMLDLGHVDPTKDARTDTEYEVWVVNDRQEPINFEVEIRFISVKTGADVLPVIHKYLLAGANCTSTVVKTSIGPLNPDLEDSSTPFDLSKYDPYVIHATLKHVDQDEILSSDAAWPQPFKYLDFTGERLSMETSRISNEELQVHVNASHPVKGLVFEERRGLILSSNNFDVIPGAHEIVVVIKGSDLTDVRYTYIGAPSGSIQLDTSTV